MSMTVPAEALDYAGPLLSGEEMYRLGLEASAGGHDRALSGPERGEANLSSALDELGFGDENRRVGAAAFAESLPGGPKGVIEVSGCVGGSGLGEIDPQILGRALSEA